MIEYTFEQLINIDQLRQLLESYHCLSGMAYGLYDSDDNGIVYVGWQEICTMFHKAHPICSEHGRESKTNIRKFLCDSGDGFFEYRCVNGMIDAAMPVIIEGRHLATFLIGQFFYDDEPPDRAIFLDQAREFGFDPDEYLDAFEHVPVLSREHIRANLKFLHSMVRFMAESGLKNLRFGLRLTHETEQFRLIEERHAIFGFALDQMREAAFVIDKSGRFHYVNQEACRSLGYSRAELIGMTVPDIDPDFFSDKVHQNIKRLHKAGAHIFESYHRTHDGRIFPVEITTTLFEHNGVSYNLSLVRDISERKRALRKSEIFLDTLLDTIPIPIYYKDTEGRYLGFNRAFEEFFGASKEQLIGKTAFDISPPELAETNHRQETALFAQGGVQRFESLVRNIKGELRNVVFNKAVFADHDNKPCGMIDAIVDITEHKLAEQQLRYSEQQFRTLAENTPGMIMRYDRDCRRVYVNPAFTRERGISANMAMGVPLKNAWKPGVTITSEEYESLLRRVMTTGEPVEILLEWPNRVTGRLSNSHCLHLVAERSADGKIIGCLAIGHDITRLRETELKLAKLAETSPGVLYNLLMKADGTFCLPYASRRIRELFALWPEEMEHDITEAASRIHPGDLRSIHQSLMESARALSLWRLEFRILHPARGEVWVEGNSIPERQADGGILWSGFLHDISDRKRSEEALHTKQKQLATLTAELSLAEERERQNIAAVLHEHIGQSLLLGKIKLGTLVVDQITGRQKKLVRETITLLDQVTREIHTLSVQLNPPILAAVGLEAALEWLGRRMKEDYGLLVEFRDDLKEKPLPDEVSSFVYQCGRELLINVAKHANTDHARIVVERENGNYRLTIEDDGDGFEPANLTFDASRDCGFSLLSMRMRIERMGGRVLFDSAPGQGSRMTILAPLASSELKKSDTISVLLVDAHKLVREGLKSLLDKADDIRIVGEADDESKALQLATEMQPDVVVMDLSMPVMSGINATRRIIEMHPDAKILALSTLQDDECAQECFMAGAKGYLVKNCATEELLIAIRALATGKLFLCSKVTGFVMQEFSQNRSLKSSSSTSNSELSKRELEVLKLIADGVSTKEIAFLLNVSVKTIEVQRFNIMKKLDLHSVAALTKYAVRTGLTSID